MKKILIVSYLFAPNNGIGALRPTKIAKLLSQKGYWVDVVSAGYLGNDTMEIPENIHMWYAMNDQKVNRPNVASKKKKTIRYLKFLRQTWRSYLSRQGDKCFLNFFRNLYEKELSKVNYDVAITSFGPLASLECGLFIKKKNKNIKWICDFRDPVVTDITPFVFKWFWKYKEQQACRKADKIVAVSEGYISRICGRKYKGKRYMIPNGFDISDKNDEIEYRYNKDKFEITYVGSLYEGRRKLTPVFGAISDLIKQKSMDPSSICINYAGADGDAFYRQAEQANLKTCLRNYGLLSRAECLNLQFSSDLLVLSTWNSRNEYGVFPGKLLEYMLIGKPIISITDGDLGDGEVSKVIREGCFGVAYESVNHEKDYVYLKEYLKNAYQQWIQCGCIEFTPSEKVLERYNYDNIILQSEDLISE